MRDDIANWYQVVAVVQRHPVTCMVKRVVRLRRPGHAGRSFPQYRQASSDSSGSASGKGKTSSGPVLPLISLEAGKTTTKREQSCQ